MSTDRPQPRRPEEPKISLLRNPVSLIGAAIAATSLATIAFLFFVNFISVRPSPYIGVLGFMVAPAFLILGLLLIPLGMLLERWRRRKQKPGVIPRFPKLDLNIPAQRTHLLFSLASLRVRADERRGQLPSLRVHRLGAVLRATLPHHHAT